MDFQTLKSDIEQLCESTQSASSCYLNKSVLKHHIQSAPADYIVVINKKFTTASTFNQGLELLQILIDCCPVDLLTENAVSWIRIAANHRNNKQTNAQQLLIIEKLVTLCAGIQEFRKTVFSDYLPSILDLCITPYHNPNLPNVALKCLTICFKKFPKACGPFKKKTELFLLRHLNSQSLSTEQVKKSAVAFHFLQQVGEGDGIRHQNNWTNTLQKLCMTTHKILDVFLEDAVEFGSFENTDTPVHEFPTIPSALSKYEVLQVHYNRLRNCLIFVQAMLDKHFTVPKVIPLQTLVNVISRGLSVHVCSSGKSMEVMHLSVIIIRCQIDLLYMLRSFIGCAKQHLIPFSFIITRLLIDCLNRTQTCSCFNSSSDYQCTVYKVFNIWITLARNGISDSFHEKFISLVKADILPNEHKTVLQLNISHTSKKSKKRKLAQTADIFTTTNNSTPLNVNKNKKVCIASLECLIAILECTCLNIGPTVTTELYECVVKTLLDIQGGKTVQQYENPKCCALLYTVLTSLVQQPYLKIPPPLDVAINLLQADRINFNPSKEVNILERISQPAYPPLQVQHKISFNSDKVNEEMSDFDNLSPADNEVETYTDIPMENAEEIQPKSPKIHIIDNLLIQPPRLHDTVNHISNGDHKLVEETVDAHQATKSDVKPLTKNTDDLVNNIKDRSTLSPNNGLHSEDFETKTKESHSVIIKPITSVEEPILKKRKEHLEPDEEDMMSSFNDVINDY